MSGDGGAIRSLKKTAELKRLEAGTHPTTTMEYQMEGEKSPMRVFLLFVLAALFVALGALEVVAARAVLPLP